MMSSSDRKRSIVAQVKPMSRHHSRAGTAKWTMPGAAARFPFVTETCNGCPEFGQAVEIEPSTPTRARIASASQMQLPHHWRGPERTRKDVGTAENGSAIQM